MTMKRLSAWAAGLVCAAAFVVPVLAIGGADAQPERPLQSVHRVQEDSPQWDCHTMGNRRCGPLR